MKNLTIKKLHYALNYYRMLIKFEFGPVYSNGFSTFQESKGITFNTEYDVNNFCIAEYKLYL